MTVIINEGGGGGGSGGVCVAPDTMEPEGVKTASPGCQYLQYATADDGTVTAKFWIKISGENTNTGWAEYFNWGGT